MKKMFFYLLMVFTIISCGLDDDTNSYHLEILPVEEYVVPEIFTQGNTYPIKLFYKRPTTCYGYDGIYYNSLDSIRTIGIQTFVLEQSNCTPIDDDAPLSHTSFEFHVTQTIGTSYVFRFFKGRDHDGNNIFDEIEIPVVE